MKNADLHRVESPDEPCSPADPPAEKTSVTGAVRSLFSYCPYTMAGKKVLRIARGEPVRSSPPTNREIYLKSQIKIGYGIMFVGILCPIFWFSYLSGARGEELMFNAIHSGIVILFGLAFVIVYQIQMRREKCGNRSPDSDAGRERKWCQQNARSKAR